MSKKPLLYVALFCAICSSADPLEFHITRMANGVTFRNSPGTLQLSIGFGDCGLFPTRDFVICTTGAGSSVTFGDGEYGVTPGSGGTQVQATYSAGNGANGNLTSTDSLGFFLKRGGSELDGVITDLVFTPVCHPACDSLTMEASFISGQLDGTVPITGEISLPDRVDVLALLRSPTPQSITGEVVPEPSTVSLLFLALPVYGYLARRTRSDQRRSKHRTI